METFKKRQKELRRMERQRDKAAKRKENRARKIAGIPSESDRDSAANHTTAASEPADLSTMDSGNPGSPGEGGSRGDPVSRL